VGGRGSTEEGRRASRASDIGGGGSRAASAPIRDGLLCCVVLVWIPKRGWKYVSCRAKRWVKSVHGGVETLSRKMGLVYCVLQSLDGGLTLFDGLYPFCFRINRIGWKTSSFQEGCDCCSEKKNKKNIYSLFYLRYIHSVNFGVQVPL